MSEQNKIEKEVALEKIITTAVQIPGIKVNREEFLTEIFASGNTDIENIVDLGPIRANISQEELSQLAGKLILKRTASSSIASFAAGIPGGLAMAATIPLDVLQFFSMAIRLAQELSYLYGAEDLWQNGQLDDEKVKGQLLLYCGVMFGVSGAVSGVRVLSTQIAKTTLKKLPQKALTKTFWYPMIKQIGKAVGVKVTKSTVAKGISNAIPIIGGVVSGGLNFASMLPMANRLQAALDSANFNYTEEEFENDLYVIENIDEAEEEKTAQTPEINSKIVAGGKKLGENILGRFSKKGKVCNSATEDSIETLKKLSELKDMGIITEQEFERKKEELLSQI